MIRNFSNFFNDFDDVTNLIFNNYTLDQHPVSWKKTDKGYKAICRTVGISPDDVSIEILNNGIRLSGETIVDDETYNVSYNIPISSKIMSNVEGITYEVKNGLTYIYLNVKTDEVKQIPISRI